MYRLMSEEFHILPRILSDSICYEDLLSLTDATEDREQFTIFLPRLYAAAIDE